MAEVARSNPWLVLTFLRHHRAPRINRETKAAGLVPPPTSKYTRQGGSGTTTSKKDGSSSSGPGNPDARTAGADTTTPSGTGGSGTSRSTTGRPMTLDPESIRLRPEGGAECKTS